jgi:hypothetical protein
LDIRLGEVKLPISDNFIIILCNKERDDIRWRE